MKSLYYVPNVHDSGESIVIELLNNIRETHPNKRRELDFAEGELREIWKLVPEYWSQVYKALESSGVFAPDNICGLRVYMEGVPFDVDSDKLTSTLAEQSSAEQTFLFLRRLIKLGAKIYGAESAELHAKNLKAFRQFSKRQRRIEIHEAYKLIRARDNFIARHLHEALPENSTAVLLMGAKHKVPKSLRAIGSDIVVIEVRVDSRIEAINDLPTFLENLEKRFKAST